MLNQLSESATTSGQNKTIVQSQPHDSGKLEIYNNQSYWDATRDCDIHSIKQEHQ